MWRHFDQCGTGKRKMLFFFFFQVCLTLNDPMRMSLQFGLLCVYFPVFTCNLCILVCVCTVWEQLCKAFLAAPNLLNTWLIVLNAFLVFFNEWLVGLIFDSVLLLQLFNVHSTSVSDIVLIHLWILKIKKKGGEKWTHPLTHTLQWARLRSLLKYLIINVCRI